MASVLRPGRSRILAVAAGLACAATLSLLVVSSASAATTLHFFSKQVSSKLTGPSGQPLNPNAVPAVGDMFANTSLNYVGNHKHHAKKWTSSDHLVCTFTAINASGGTATCNGQIAIGGSMLLAENVTLTFSNSGSSVAVAITGGTGKFRGVHGHVKSKNVGKTNNSDLTITYS
jgi:hypothetical protein